ncbi:MAG: S-layer homology domain-containing protein, partial [Oscillospiraceae bacterium]
MKSVKVLIISLIIFSLSINISPIVFADIPDEKVQNSEMATMVLKYLNIISESEGITFDATKGVKREELARFLWKLNDDNQELLPCETNFKDVDSTNANSGYISAMNKAKVMLGDTDGLFYPEQLITYNEAIITLVRLCGYEPMVDIKSGSDGYYKVATSIDLLKGIANTSKTDVISCGTLLTLMYNSLDIPLMMIEKYGENPTYIKDENKTILTEVFGLYFEEGVVSATCDTALTHEKSGLQKSQVEISGKVYATSGSSVETYLGHKIKFLYKNLDGSHEREVVLVLKDFSRVTQINADDIIEFSDYT